MAPAAADSSNVPDARLRRTLQGQAEPARERLEAFDAFRGLAIVLVVMGHSAGFGWGFRDVPGGRLDFLYSVFVRNLALCSLPVFLFLSGYWLASTPFGSRGDYTSFLRKRTSRIAVPYLFWSVFFLTLSALRSGVFSPSEFVLKILLGAADGPYYFIHLMLQFYVLAPFFSRWSRRTSALLWLVFLHIAVVAALYVLRFFYLPDLSYAAVKLPFLSWLCFFPLGMYARRHPEWVHTFGTWRLGAATLFLIVLVNVETCVLLRYSHIEFAISDIRFTPLLYAAAAIFLMLQTTRWPWPKLLVRLGEYAFGIFFIHGFFLRASGFALKKIPGLFDCQPAFQSLVVVSTLAASCVVILVMRRIIGKEPSSRLLGF